MHDVVLAALKWDPQIRGGLIVLTAFSILVGSVFMLLSTNVGSKLGFVLALTGLTGWLTVLAGVWSIFGIGFVGDAPTWKPKEIVTGDLKVATTPAMRDFPKGFKLLPKGDPHAGDAQAAADRVLSSNAANTPLKPGEEAKPDPILKQFPSPFKATTDYVPLQVYTKGGDNQLFTIGRHKFYLFHSPHYTIVQVKPAIPKNDPTAAGPAQADFTRPTVTVVQLRDLGSIRFPSLMLMIASGIVVGICCYSLHQRDKEILRLRAAPATAAA
jgi:hypothetical protein